MTVVAKPRLLSYPMWVVFSLVGTSVHNAISSVSSVSTLSPVLHSATAPRFEGILRVNCNRHLGVSRTPSYLRKVL